MCLQLTSLTLICLGCLAVQTVSIEKHKHQFHKYLHNSDQSLDQIASESELDDLLETSASKNSPVTSKYFQDMYVAQNNPKELEFGHVCENPNEWEQRFEKLNLETLNRQGKVRWGDKDGGYGEHYWDYNHADQGDGTKDKKNQKGESPSPSRDKRNPDDEVEFISSEAESSIRNVRTPKHGGNYRRAHEIRSKRQPIKVNLENLISDSVSNRIMHGKTGVQYQPKNN